MPFKTVRARKCTLASVFARDSYTASRKSFRTDAPGVTKSGLKNCHDEKSNPGDSLFDENDGHWIDLGLENRKTMVRRMFCFCRGIRWSSYDFKI